MAPHNKNMENSPEKLTEIDLRSPYPGVLSILAAELAYGIEFDELDYDLKKKRPPFKFLQLSQLSINLSVGVSS